MTQWTLRLDSGNSWRSPFGLDRVGSPPVVRVVAEGGIDVDARDATIEIVAFRDGLERERHRAQLHPSIVFFDPIGDDLVGVATLRDVPDEIAVELQGRIVVRERVTWPRVEVAVRSRSVTRANPVDLGAVLVPDDWLLAEAGHEVSVRIAALSKAEDIADARFHVGFDGEPGVAIEVPLRAGERDTMETTVVVPSSDKANLRVSLFEGESEIWAENIRTMVIRKRPPAPEFGAVWTDLRYDGTIPIRDEETGERTRIDYDDGWKADRRDVVVFLPNGSRFVFWKGANYIPFWASDHNVGFTYEWAETIHPEDGYLGSVEPLSDRELRYGTVRIIESSAARIHVQWRYQPSADFPYRTWGEYATEDFIFYPDGFGTRTLTLASAPGQRFELSEFIIFTPQAAYPLERLQPRLIALSSGGRTSRVAWPDDAHRGYLELPAADPAVFRIFPRDDDPRSWVYFSPLDAPTNLMIYAPRVAEGEEISPGFWEAMDR